MFNILRIHGTITEPASDGRTGREAAYALMVFAASAVVLLSVMGWALDLVTASSL